MTPGVLGEQPTKISIALLVGDVTVLSLFTLGGWLFHRVPGMLIPELARIGLPFFVGYFLVAFSIDALKRPVSFVAFWKRTLCAWGIGIGMGIVLRTILEGRPPITSFVYVTMIFTGVLLFAWRCVYWALSRPR